MEATIDKAGRVVIPARIRQRPGLKPGTKLEVTIEDGSVRLSRKVSGPILVRENGHLIAKPTVPEDELPEIDIAALIEEERCRRPSSSTRAS